MLMLVYSSCIDERKAEPVENLRRAHFEVPRGWGRG
jgi:hypothetical protein